MNVCIDNDALRELYISGKSAHGKYRTMSRDAKLIPAIAICPGEYILDTLQENNISIEMFAKSIDISLEKARNLLLGTEKVDAEIAEKLQAFTHVSAQTWLNLQNDYDRIRQHHNDVNKLQTHYDNSRKVQNSSFACEPSKRYNTTE